MLSSAQTVTAPLLFTHADSESSSVRRLDLGSGGSRLLVGGDPMFSDNLFRFGDKVRGIGKDWERQGDSEGDSE